MELKGFILGDKYKIIRKIGEGGMSYVWLAADVYSGEQYAVKTLKKEATSGRLEDIIRFRNEVNTVSRHQGPGVVKVYEVGEENYIHYMVMELLEGESLQQLLDRGVEFSAGEVTDLIYEICRALQHIHRAGVIHRDIKPGNIIVRKGKNGASPAVKLIDFGLAQVKEFNIKESAVIAGTLSYMSPEQSGAIRRPLDERSDLYSTGIIMYQLLTGVIPFKGSNLSTMMHQHIAKIPDLPTKLNADIPEILEKIVFKALEKEPESRYQSVDGLINDLDRFRQGQVNFVPGTKDNEIKLSFHSKLTGREKELQDLKDAYFRAGAGKGSVFLIAGEEGLGKTRLAEEFGEFVTEKQGLFIAGKCIGGINKIPYGPFKDILNSYMSSYQQYNRDMRRKIAGMVQEETGGLGEIITDFSPVMKELLGEPPPVVKLDAEKETARFYNVTSRFFGTLARQDKTMVVFLDDLQWADEGSLELLAGLALISGDYPLLILGTYRRNEINEGHSLKQITEDAGRDNFSLNTTTLLPFNDAQMNELLANLLLDAEEDFTSVADYLLQKTRGNPLYSIEIVKELVKEKILFRQDGRWHVRKDKLEKAEVCASMVDILVKKISYLTARETELLSYAALIGKNVRTDLLLKLKLMPITETVAIIDNAVKLQLLERDYEDKNNIYFLHEHIRDIFYQKLSPEKRKEFHLKVAGLLEVIYSGHPGQVVFELARHYAETAEREKALTYALQAGRKAGENYANEDALFYFLLAKEILEEEGRKGTAVWTECLEHISELYLITGRNDKAMEIMNELLGHRGTGADEYNTGTDEYNKGTDNDNTGAEKYYTGTDDDNKVKIYERMCRAYYQTGDWDKAIKNGREGMKLLKERLPDNKISLVLAVSKEIFVFLFRSLFPGFYERRPGSKNKEKYIKIQSFYYTLCWTYVLSDVGMAIYLAFRGVNLATVNNSRSRELALTWGGLANIFMSIPLFSLSNKYHARSIALREELNDRIGLGQSYQWRGYEKEFEGDYEQALHYFNKAMDTFRGIGDIKEQSMTLNGLVHIRYYLSEYENMKKLNDEYHQAAVRAGDVYSRIASHIYYIQYYRETGDMDKSEEHGLESERISREMKDWFNVCVSNIELGITYIHKEEFAEAVSCLSNAVELYDNNIFLEQYTAISYLYLADACIKEHLRRRSLMDKSEERASVQKIGRIYRKARRKTKKWPTHRGVLMRVGANYSFLKGKHQQADSLFLQSIDQLTGLKRKFEIALTNYEYALFLAEINRGNEANKRAENAYSVFKETGAAYYKRLTARFLGFIDGGLDSSAERFKTDLRYARRLSTMIEMSREISSVLNIDELLARIMHLAIEVTGARRGCILFIDEEKDELVLRAEKDISGSNQTGGTYSRLIVAEVLKNQQTVLSENAMEDDRFRKYDSVIAGKLKSVLGLPLRQGNEIKGVCYLENSLSAGVFTEEDLEILNVMMAQAAISIENARLYEDLNQSNEQLKELDALKSDFISAVSHELRTPMTSIHGFASLIEKKVTNVLYPNVDNYDKKEKRAVRQIKDNIEIILKETNKLTAMINDVLDISNMESGETEWHYEKVSFRDITVRAYQETKSLLERNGLQYDQDISHALPELYADAKRLQQVMVNLLSNAVKFTEEGGVRVAARLKEDGRRLTVRVSDTGTGIAPADLKIIFDRFKQTGDIMTDKPRGTGLGLPICREIITHHGGKIWAESKPGAGTTIIFELPLPDDE